MCFCGEIKGSSDRYFHLAPFFRNNWHKLTESETIICTRLVTGIKMFYDTSTCQSNVLYSRVHVSHDRSNRMRHHLKFVLFTCISIRTQIQRHCSKFVGQNKLIQDDKNLLEAALWSYPEPCGTDTSKIRLYDFYLPGN